MQRSRGTVLGFPVLDEDLRLLRASTLYAKGIPFFTKREVGLSFTAGLGGNNAPDRMSLPGATDEFLTIAAAASIQLSERYVFSSGVIAQWTDDSLPLSARCGFATNTFSHAFDRSFVNGDRCLGVRHELAVNANFLKIDGLRLGQVLLGADYGYLGQTGNDLVAK